ncbi:MAG: hypothetical protein ABII22_04230 [Candidatus Micrarchaeota archaeon]
MKNSRGQVAIEFFVYSAMFLFVVVAAYFLVNYMQESEIPPKENSLVEEVGQSFADAATLSVYGGKGFTYTFSFSKSVLGNKYYISMYGDKLGIDSKMGSSEFGSIYTLPKYNYIYEGDCWDDREGVDKDNNPVVAKILDVSKCKNYLTFSNDGDVLTITSELG